MKTLCARTSVALMSSLHVQYQCWQITVVNEFKSSLVGHHSAEVASIEDNVTYWFDDLRNSSISKCYGKVTTEQPFIAINIERFV